MFTKLLKHEFRATRSMIGMLCLTAIGLGIVGGGAWILNSSSGNATVKAVCLMALAACFLTIAICAVGAMAVLLVHFYRSRFTDQGYLTFTLPVSTHKQLLAGTTNMVLNILLVMVSTVAAYGLLVFIPISTIDGFWATVWEELPLFWEKVMEHMTLEIFGTFVLAFFAVVLNCLCQLVLVMTSMTVGAFIAKKHKVLAAVGVYYLSQIILPLLMFRVMIVATEFVQVLWIISIGSTLVILAGYFLMHFLMSRKLNLP